MKKLLLTGLKYAFIGITTAFALLVSYDATLTLYCNHERNRVDSKEWYSVNDTPMPLIQDILYSEQFPDNKRTIHLMENGY